MLVRFVVTFVNVFAVLESASQCGADEIVIMNVGDSVSSGKHRLELQELMNLSGQEYDFVGDHSAGGTTEDTNYQGWGGAWFSHMLSGRYVDRGSGPKWEAGIVDALDRYSPNTFLVLGGYNNMVGETVGGGLATTKQQVGALIDHMVNNAPQANIFFSNITDFDPTKTWGHKRPNVLEFNTWLANEIDTRRSAGQRIQLVDNFSIVGYEDLLGDGLHVAESGHEKIGQNWFNAIQAAQSVPEPNVGMLLVAVSILSSCVYRSRCSMEV